MPKVVINYIGLDGEAHRGYVEKNRITYTEYLENGEYYGTEFLLNRHRKIRICTQESFLKARGESLGLIKKKTITKDKKNSKQSGLPQKKDDKDLDYSLAILFVPLLIGLPLWVFKDLDDYGIIGDLIALIIQLLPPLVVYFKTGDSSSAIKWAAASLISVFIFVIIGSAIFGNSDIVLVPVFWIPVILSGIAFVLAD